jgi:hypothetical protein
MKDVAEAKRHAKYKYKENLKSRKNKRGWLYVFVCGKTS